MCLRGIAMRIGRSECGETQLGVLIAGLLLGVLCWGVFSLQSCIEEHKESKVVQRREQYIRDHKLTPQPRRDLRGYQVSY